MNDYGRILLLSDAAPAVNGMGARRTLFNVFSRWPEENFCAVVWRDCHSVWKSATRFKNGAVPIRRHPIWLPRRFIPRFRQLTRGLYAIWHRLLAIRLRTEAVRFNPDLVLIYAESPDILTVAYRLLDKIDIPHVLYLMDDILDPKDALLSCESRQCFQNATGWIVISDALADHIAKRWEINKPPFVIAHNPVDTHSILPMPPLQREASFQIAYAGSIWQMHADALELTARAVESLRHKQIPVELVIYTSEAMWNHNKHRLELAGCRYGGFRDPKQLAVDLQKANLLLVCSSFSPEMKGFASYSAQTKLTDYMTAGRPILSVGPPYAICHEFVNRWKCGFVWESESVEEYAKFLTERISACESDYAYGQNGYNAVFREFSVQSVSERVNSFLNQTVSGCRTANSA